MYKIIRRISSSFFPRPDRPWSEDATSTAPQIGRKRRLSTNEDEERETTPSAKKHRAGSESAPESAREQSPSQPGKETAEVKEVTEGVREVELEDGKTPAPASVCDVPAEKAGVEEAAAVPLPDSPELKPTEGAGTPDGELDAEGATKGEVVSLAEDDAKSSEAPNEPLSQEITPSTSAEDDVPGLTLPSEEVSPPATAATAPDTQPPVASPAPAEASSSTQ
ncbi:hypothetical protein FKP32DRAFT_1682316 [Trametes sanguinea]|nr:hypothetical protein FKP32DRAFT_1682316 [Trametes sanguinea]